MRLGNVERGDGLRARLFFAMIRGLSRFRASDVIRTLAYHKHLFGTPHRAHTQAVMRGGIAPATPAAVIASATRPEERILVSTIDRVAAEARAQGFEPPAIVVIGENVAVREGLSAMAEKAGR